MPGPRLSLSAVLAGAMLLLPAVAVAGAGEGVAAPELRALGELYTATGGPHWKRSDNWLQKDPCANGWYGVSCTDGVVRKLRLVNNRLAGTLPDSIGQLSGLRELTVTGNQLSGSFPAGLRHLWELRVFSASRNAMSGPLPDWLGELLALREINLSYNVFTRLPPTLGALQNLTELNVYSNRLAGPLPQEIGQLRGLKRLYLINNQLAGPIPASFAGLTHLERLALADNRLTGVIPAFIPQLPVLTYISTGQNQWACPLPEFKFRQQRDPPLTFCLDTAPTFGIHQPVMFRVRGYNLSSRDRWGLIGSNDRCNKTAASRPTVGLLEGNHTLTVRLPEGLPVGAYFVCYWRSSCWYRNWPFPATLSLKVGRLEVSAAAPAAPPLADPLDPPHTSPTAPGPAGVAPASCQTRADCSHHGHCIGHRCLCHRRWRGPTCAECNTLLYYDFQGCSWPVVPTNCAALAVLALGAVVTLRFARRRERKEHKGH